MDDAAYEKLVSDYSNLKLRPDYDGFVGIGEGVRWAKAHRNSDGDPHDALYLDASKLNFGNLSVSDVVNNLGIGEGNVGNVNLFNYVSWPSTTSRATTYALGNTQIKLLDASEGTVQLFSDRYDWDYHGPPSESRRDRLIQIERFRAGVGDSHGVPIHIYGTGKLKR